MEQIKRKLGISGVATRQFAWRSCTDAEESAEDRPSPLPARMRRNPQRSVPLPSGAKVGTGPGEAVSHVPEFILVSTEAKDFRQNLMTGPAAPGLEAALAAGDDFQVDYVRVFDPAP